MADQIKKSGIEIGESGTNFFDGFITEEYNAELAGTTGIKVYEEMRKSDATVRAILQAVTLPIRRAVFFIKPASQDDADMEVKDFVHNALFNWMSINWDDFIRQALLNLAFGVMVFEKVFEMRNIDGKDRIVWKKFAPRMPKSIISWQLTNKQPGIQQQTIKGSTADIPMEKLLVFVNEMEGENWWGTSLLRAAYKHWYIKSTLEKIDAIAHERQGVGIPFVKLPSGYSATDKTQAETILKNLRAHENSYLLEPDHMSVEFKDMKAITNRDATRSIAYHNREITKAVLAQFLELGSGPSGSRALSTDQTDLFLQSIEAIANSFIDKINNDAIPELVDLNFEGVTDYPKLDYTGVSRSNVDELSTSYQRLVQSGGIKPTLQDEQYLRAEMGLPEKPEEEIERERQEQSRDAEDAADEIGLSEFVRGKKKIETALITRAIDIRLSEYNIAQQINLIRHSLGRIKRTTGHSKLFGEAEAILNRRLSTLERLIFQETNEFKAWRKLTFAEKKVNFQSLQDNMDKFEQTLDAQSKAMLQQSKDEYVSKLTTAFDNKDKTAIKSLQLKFQRDYAKLVRDQLTKVYEFGKTNAAREMGVNSPANDRDVLRSIDILADQISTDHMKELEKTAKIEIVNKLQRQENTAQTMAAVDAAMAKTITQLINDTKAIVVAGYVNEGRRTVFNRNEKKIYALQRSEILDSKTCNFCLSVDGRIVQLNDSLARIGTFHSGCRGIWVEILQEEDEKPDITGVPQSLRDRIGDKTNELLQPKNPIVKKDSLASSAISKGKAGK